VLARVNEGDRLISVGLTDGKTKDILLATAQGMAIRFREDDVRPMGLVAAGVNGMKLDDKDEVVGVEILPSEGEVFMITNDGKAKRVGEKDFPIQGRYGKGVIAWDLPAKVRLAGIAADKPNYMATIHLTKGAPKSTRLDAAGIRKRAATKGDAVVEVKPGEEVVSINVGWTVERFVEEQKEKPTKAAPKPSSLNGRENGKSPSAKKNIPAKKAKAPAKKSMAKKPATKTKTPKKKKK
jgi:DNA gyrase/topoisomerase IV subunit A